MFVYLFGFTVTLQCITPVFLYPSSLPVLSWMKPLKFNPFSPLSCKGFDQPLTSQNSEFSATRTFRFLKWHPGSLPHLFFLFNKCLLSIAIKILGKKGLVLFHSYLDTSEFLEKIEAVYKTCLWAEKRKLKKRGIFSENVWTTEFSDASFHRQTECMDWLPLQKIWVFLRSYVITDSAIWLSQTMLVNNAKSIKPAGIGFSTSI